jgi:hypothetical protein
MKSVRFAYTVFLLLLIAVMLNSLLLGKIIDTLEYEVTKAEEEDMSAAHSEYTNIYDKYKKYELYISLSVSHDDLSNLEDAFAEIIAAAKADDRSTLITTKSRLTDYLRHIKRLSGINIDSIF